MTARMCVCVFLSVRRVWGCLLTLSPKEDAALCLPCCLSLAAAAGIGTGEDDLARRSLLPLPLAAPSLRCWWRWCCPWCWFWCGCCRLSCSWCSCSGPPRCFCLPPSRSGRTFTPALLQHQAQQRRRQQRNLSRGAAVGEGGKAILGANGSSGKPSRLSYTPPFSPPQAQESIAPAAVVREFPAGNCRLILIRELNLDMHLRVGKEGGEFVQTQFRVPSLLPLGRS